MGGDRGILWTGVPAGAVFLTGISGFELMLEEALCIHCSSFPAPRGLWPRNAWSLSSSSSIVVLVRTLRGYRKIPGRPALRSHLNGPEELP
jgi:hypothetical protein